MQKFIVEEVRTVEGVRRDATHKVGSRKSPGGIGLLQTLTGGVFYTQHQSPYFRVRVPNEGSTEKFSQPKLPPSISVLSCF